MWCAVRALGDAVRAWPWLTEQVHRLSLAAALLDMQGGEAHSCVSIAAQRQRRLVQAKQLRRTASAARPKQLAAKQWRHSTGPFAAGLVLCRHCTAPERACAVQTASLESVQQGLASLRSLVVQQDC